jgi:hypothetical protein
MPPYSPSLAIRDYLKPYLRLCTARERRRLYALCRSLLQSRSSVLSRAARSRLTRRRGVAVVLCARVDNWVKSMSTLLEQLPWNAFRQRHFQRLRQRQERRKLVIHDASDIAKPFAEKLDGLSPVRDGSTGQIVNGYEFCFSTGVGWESWDIHPIAATLINPHDKDFTCQGDVFKEQIRTMLVAGIGGDCLHVFDRGFDDEKWFHFLDNQEVSWMIRLKDNRIVTFRGEEHRLSVVADTMLAERPMVRGGIAYARCDIGVRITHDGNGKKIPAETRPYALVAIRRPQYAKPMLLLFSGRVKDHAHAVRLYDRYLDRWDIEDCIKFLKNALRTEQMQLRTFKRLQAFLDLQLLLTDFLLREYDKGVRPTGAPLCELLARSIEKDTRIVSPYLLADHIGDTLKADQRYRDPCLVPRMDPQLSMFPIMDTA